MVFIVVTRDKKVQTQLNPGSVVKASIVVSELHHRDTLQTFPVLPDLLLFILVQDKHNHFQHVQCINTS